MMAIQEEGLLSNKNLKTSIEFKQQNINEPQFLESRLLYLSYVFGSNHTS